MTSHCGFDLRVSDDWWRGASFREPVGHLCALLGDVSVRVCCDASDMQVTLLLTHLPDNCLATPCFLPNTLSFYFCNMRFFFLVLVYKLLIKIGNWGIPWQSSGQGSELPLQQAWV